MLSRKARWAVPAGVVTLTGAVVAGTIAASAATAPSLPGRSAAGLLAIMRGATLPSAFTATISETANLGIPALPDIGATSPAALLTGTHMVNVWYAGPSHVRIQLPVSFGETDLRVNGRQVWLWDSKRQTATRLVLNPAVTRHGGAWGGSGPASRPGRATGDGPAGALPPLQAARGLLAAIGPSTAVSVQGTTTVAGRPAYQLVITPRTPQSLIGRITIAVDATLHVPLQVQVYPRGSGSPAFQAGFTMLRPGQPAPGNFTFTPPAGATVRTRVVPAFGGGWSGVPPGAVPLPGRLVPPHRVVSPPGSRATFRMIRPVCARPGARGPILLPMQRLQPVPRHLPSGQPMRVIRLRSGQLRIEVLRPGHPPRVVRLRPGQVPPAPAGRRGHVACVVFPLRGALPWGGPAAGGFAGPAGPLGPLGLRGARVIGSGWLAVVVLPGGPVPVVQGIGGTNAYSSSGSAAYSSSLSVRMDSNPVSDPLGAILRGAARVHGAWGSGRLLRTPLLSVLLTSKGQILAGAVTPAVLFADAATLR
jgi:outer membrane lipoprotein-sorting protein